MFNPFVTMQTSARIDFAKGKSTLESETVDARPTDLCQLTSEELGAVAGGPEVQVGDGG